MNDKLCKALEALTGEKVEPPKAIKKSQTVTRECGSYSVKVGPGGAVFNFDTQSESADAFTRLMAQTGVLQATADTEGEKYANYRKAMQNVDEPADEPEDTAAKAIEHHWNELNNMDATTADFVKKNGLGGDGGYGPLQMIKGPNGEMVHATVGGETDREMIEMFQRGNLKVEK